MSADDVFYRRFFEALPDAAFVLDLQTASFVDVNEALVAMYGWSRDELATPGVVELSAEPEASRAALKAPQNGVYPRRHRRRDGTVFPVETSAARVDFDGRPYVVGVTRDVSTQHRYEAELRGRKALIASAFDTSPLMISICTFPDRRLIEVNEAFCRGTGFSREEVLGRTTGELGVAVPDQLAAHQAQLEASGRVDGREFAYQSRSGVRVPVRVWSQVLETSQGPRLFTAAEDITARKRDEATRAALVERIGKIASRLPGVIYQFRRTADGSLSFPYASPALEALYGVKPEDVKEDGRPAFACVHPDDLAAMIESTNVSARDLTTWTFEHRVVRPDGSVRWMQGNAVPEREPDGSTLWHGFIADVTDQKAREAALRVSEERFQLAMEATSDALWDWDFVSGSAYASPNYARSLGYEPSEFPTGFAAWEQHVHPDDRAAAIAASRRCIEG
ncbi:MAG TPA: PAS domain S-box protein, partial [Archangium sp.]